MVYQVTKWKSDCPSRSSQVAMVSNHWFGRRNLQTPALLAAFLLFVVSTEGQPHGHPAPVTNHTANGNSHSPPHTIHHHPPPHYHRTYHRQPPPSPHPNVTLGPSANVTMLNMTIYDKHAGWLDVGTDVYFRCEGENKRFLPNVKEVNEMYLFHGTEPFQPLTTLQADSCKKCGLYEKDTWSSDDVFAEWLLCPQNFTSKAAVFHVFFKDQFSATFHCPECHTISNSASGGRSAADYTISVIFILFLVLNGLVVVFVVVLAVLLLRKRYVEKAKEEEKVRFMELFDDDDELEKELEDSRY